MLALAASELAQTEKHSHQLQNLALAHRVKSITALNAAIQRGVNSSEEGNAMLATCFSLLFQSTLITEGLIEYMTFMRGTIVVSTQMYGSKLRFFFDRTEEDDRPTEPPDGTRDVPIIQRDLVLGACRSLESLKSLCHAGAEIQIRNKLLDIARSLLASTAHGKSNCHHLLSNRYQVLKPLTQPNLYSILQTPLRLPSFRMYHVPRRFSLLLRPK